MKRASPCISRIYSEFHLFEIVLAVDIERVGVGLDPGQLHEGAFECSQRDPNSQVREMDVAEEASPFGTLFGRVRWCLWVTAAGS